MVRARKQKHTIATDFNLRERNMLTDRLNSNEAEFKRILSESTAEKEQLIKQRDQFKMSRDFFLAISLLLLGIIFLLVRAIYTS